MITKKDFFLQNCLCAIDGTYIGVRARKEDQPKYHDRKGDISINVFVAVNPRIESMHCLVGWEGSAQDFQVLKDAITKPYGLKVPKDNTC